MLDAMVHVASSHVPAQIVTFAGQTLNNYLMYMGGTGVYAATMVYDRE